jgi:YcaO-like protein with predicted kinase domain
MQLKKYTNGTHRHCTPEQTLEKISPFLQDMGITRVANLTGLDNIGIPVIGVYRPNSKSLATSQGKGHSVNAAKVSGIMESIEGFHAENIKLETITDSHESLNSKLDYQLLSRSSAKDFDDKTIIRWVECHSIKNNSPVWLPYELIHTEFTTPTQEDAGYFIADSNGLASGNTLTEAINHGLYEVIERDCLALWQLTPQEAHHKNRINLSTITDSYLQPILNKLIEKNVNVGIWDITNDIGIPTFLCKVISVNNTGIRPAYGSGTHLNKTIALSRAITEAAQSRVTFIAGARDDQYHDVYENEISNTTYNSWLDELQNINTDLLKSFKDIPCTNLQSLDEDQAYILSQLDKVGLNDAFYADLTQEKYNIPVVKVIIPGTEGITAPGRRLLGSRGLKFYKQYGVGACEVK